MLVYNKINGDILAMLPDSQNPYNFFINRPEDFKKNMETLNIENFPSDLENYKIIEGELVKRPEYEIFELQLYRRILTEEERLLERLKPSYEKIQKAKNTIEILTLLQEVL